MLLVSGGERFSQETSPRYASGLELGDWLSVCCRPTFALGGLALSGNLTEDVRVTQAVGESWEVIEVEARGVR